MTGVEIQVNRTLTSLDFDDNNFTSEGLVKIAEALQVLACVVASV